MRPIAQTLLYDDAMRMVMDAGHPIDRAERIALTEADGRVVAADVTATVDVPPFDRAAMDGYAVVAADTFGASVQSPKKVTCVDRVFTGQIPARGIGAGECIEIATGAPMPSGADAVVMVEETERAGDRVSVMTPVYPQQHVGRRAADIAIGQPVVKAGHVLNPSRIGAIAATGSLDINVYARPSVAILSTGNEIAEPGQPLAPAQIYDINRFTLETIVRRHGGVSVALPITGDSIEELSAALDTALAHDIIVFSGGSSVGERDLILDVLHRRGTVPFWHRAEAGKPTVFGTIEGKPSSACLAIDVLPLERLHAAVPFLRKVARCRRGGAHSRAPLTRRVVSTTGRHRFYTVRLSTATRARVQGLRRHHEHGQRRRVHQIPPRPTWSKRGRW